MTARNTIKHGSDEIIKGIKVRLYPTKQQEILMWKSVGAMRFIYNWTLDRQNENYKNKGKFISDNDLRKELTQLKKTDDYKWLNELSSNLIAQAVKDSCDSYKKFFKGLSNYPKFKTLRKSKSSFYVRYDRLYPTETNVNFEKIGRIKIKPNQIPLGVKCSNPRCIYDGKYWYITISIESNENQVKLNKDLSIGIDLGIKDLAICSNGFTSKNINKSKEVKRLEKKIKKLQRQISHKYEINKIGNKFIKTQNIIKLQKQIKLVYRRLFNIRHNHIHQTTNKIIKENPYRIVIEDLDVKKMMKNRYLAKSIQKQCFYEVRRQLEYKCKFNGIELTVVSRWYPSSKTCSCCGNIKKDLKLSDREYICESCGLVIDRDFNASLNLANYTD